PVKEKTCPLLSTPLLRSPQKNKLEKYVLGVSDQPDVHTAMEICVLDEHGDKIQVIIPKWRIMKVENIIKEGSFYVLENFEILPNNDAYPPTKHPYVLKFHECTAVRPSGILNIPHYIFNFVNFSELANNADYSLRVF
ncbi:replication factor-a protein 1 family protein, partial [Striga asiatica]